LGNGILFLDTCVFIDCLESDRAAQIITHAVNKDFPITTSITVLGETFTQLMEQGTNIERIVDFKKILDEWGVSFYFPNDIVRKICFYIGEGLTERDPLYHQVTDRTHLAYAISWKTDFFITSDRALRSFEIPEKITSRGYNKPHTITLTQFNRAFLMKPH
jgi:predicted nucleic acid-binding protein